MTDILPHARTEIVPGQFMSSTWFNALRNAFSTLQKKTDDLATAQAQIDSVVSALGDGEGNIIDVASAIAGKQDATPALSQLATLPDVGLVARTAGGYAARTLADSDTIAWTNADGADGDPSADFTGTAADMAYDHTASGLAATDVQAALDELAAGGGGGGGGGGSGTPPLVAAFTTFGSGITATDKIGRMQLLVTSFASAEMRGILQASIATPYTIDAHLCHVGSPTSGDETGAGLCLSDGTKLIQFTLGSLNGLPAVRIVRWNSTTSFSATPASLSISLATNDYYVRITDDGTNRKYLVSANGMDYLELYTEATNSFLTHSQFGVLVYNHGAGSLPSKTSISNWVVTSSVLGDAS